MTHLSLFSGIGGLDLAAEWAGFTTVGQCEWADYPTKVLEKHWPNVPRWRDIRTLTKEDFYARTGLSTVDAISGGFPCQPFSVAGKRKGKDDDRYLWPEMLRVIQELKPRWVVGENVANIVNMALDTVLSDLENIGYTCQPFVIPACAVDAPHRRDRVAIVSRYTNSCFKGKDGEIQERAHSEPCGICEDVSNSNSNWEDRRRGWEQAETETDAGNGRYIGEGIQEHDSRQRRSDESSLGGMDDGIPNWVDGYWPVEPDIPRLTENCLHRHDRLKCLGNAVVPAQFYPVFKAIWMIENTQ